MLLEHLPTPSPPLPSLPNRRSRYSECALGRPGGTGNPDLGGPFLLAFHRGFRTARGRRLAACEMRLGLVCETLVLSLTSSVASGR
jgi:hypothetical protein